MEKTLHSIRDAILLVAFIGALSMAPVAPEAGNTVFLLSGLSSLALLRRDCLKTFRRALVWMPLAGIALLAIAYGFATSSVNEALTGALLFAPLLAIGPLLALFRPGETPLSPGFPALLSLCGVLGAAVIASGEALSSGTFRAGESVANPIHFADVALAAGFLATLGCVYWRGPSRYVFLLGPVLASVALTLSGTRGAVLALVAMLGTAIILAFALRQLKRRDLILGVLLAAVGAVLAWQLGIAQTSAIQRLLGDLGSLQQGAVPTDTSTSLRLRMLEGGWNAFLASPWVGHGPTAFVEAAASRASVRFEGAPHLHSDLADFAASAGVLGLVAYLLFLLAPLVEVLRLARSPQRDGLIVITAALTVGYAVMGLTNAMFGILTITIYFAAISVVVGLGARMASEV